MPYLKKFFMAQDVTEQYELVFVANNTGQPPELNDLGMER